MASTACSRRSAPRNEARIAEGEPWRPEQVAGRLLEPARPRHRRLRARDPRLAPDLQAVAEQARRGTPARRRRARGERLASHRGADAAVRRMTVRLAVFDCDGTLSDGQAAICSAMAKAFASSGLAAPDPHQVRRIVGLSLPHAIGRLAPDLDDQARRRAGRHLQADVLRSPPAGPGARAAVRRDPRAARAAAHRRLDARRRHRQVRPRPQRLPDDARHVRLVPDAADRRPPPVEAASLDARDGDGRGRRRRRPTR